MVGKRSQPERKRDPIAELGRLIAQADTPEGNAPSDNPFREETVSDGYDETPELPPAPQLPVDLNEHQQACEQDEQGSGGQAYDADDQPHAAEEEYKDSAVPYAAEEHYQDNEVPRVRWHSLTLVMAMFGRALFGSACAVGYRNMFGGSVTQTLPPTVKIINEQNRVATAPSDPQAESSSNLRQISPATTGSIDNIVSRQEQPSTIGPPKAAPRASLPRTSAPATPASGQSVPKQPVPRVAAAADTPVPPRTIPAVPQRPGQSGGADAPDHEPPVAHANGIALPQ